MGFMESGWTRLTRRWLEDRARGGLRSGCQDENRDDEDKK
ncbi:MAG: hypothetical protein ACJAQT_002352 [Akkermansiaceae bacterium]|jgi:hypothetical protein